MTTSPSARWLALADAAGSVRVIDLASWREARLADRGIVAVAWSGPNTIDLLDRSGARQTHHVYGLAWPSG